MMGPPFSIGSECYKTFFSLSPVLWQNILGVVSGKFFKLAYIFADKDNNFLQSFRDCFKSVVP